MAENLDGLALDVIHHGRAHLSMDLEDLWHNP